MAILIFTRLANYHGQELKVIRLDTTHTNSRRELLWPAGVLWDVETELLPEETLQIIDTAQYPGQVLHYPGWRLCRYLPFGSGGSYTTALTMYCDLNGLRGVTAHTGSFHSKTLGCRQGFPVHFSLGPEEHINVVGLCTIEMGDPPHAWDGPYPLVSLFPRR